MLEATIQRVVYGDNGVFGVFLKEDKPFLVTLELPWRNNKQNISCIPAGTYPAVRMYSEHFSKTLFVLSGVPGRDLIELHIGNKIENSHGCILLGLSYMISDYAILNSQNAFDSLMLTMPAEGFIVNIKDLNNETKWSFTQTEV